MNNTNTYDDGNLYLDNINIYEDKQHLLYIENINKIDEKITLYKEEIDNFNNTLAEIKDMIIYEFDNYDKKINNLEKNNINLNNKINEEAYIINFIVVGLILLTIAVLFNDIMNNDVFTKFTLIDLFNNEFLDNDTIITVIDDSISEL